MSAFRQYWPWAALLALAVQTGWLLYPRIADTVVRPEHTAYEEGKAIARELGCFACHGPDGRGGVPNAGSEWETVPAFTERVPMMFAHDDQELRDYVLDGRPSSKADDPKYRAKMAGQAIQMPAYRDHITEVQLDKLIAFIRAASGLLLPDDDVVIEGMDIAFSNGCFACHGDMGGGGLPNPGSFKGYIPSFWGEDYRELVQTDDELMEWLREGKIERLASHPIARRFVEGQLIQMPAYKTILSDEELRSVAAAVRWINEGSWHDAPLLE